ncbi:MAG: GGDEF domain-containing protein [Anaerorhabdus sp.]|uniref:GGDEF domain-containing protein n=1 Tax=Anaerorhabdus sp. TaxID=1872524 RepID=UPI003A84248B
MAHYDSLTKLPDRRMLLEKCKEKIDNAGENEQGYLLFFDIDGFKLINDNFGHDAGDEFLINLGEFFSNIPMMKDSIYRNGGDEFVALIGKVEKESIRSLCHFILERVKKTWELKKGTVFCGVSIGVACYPEDGNSANQLLQVADRAMYNVKKAGGGNMLFGYEVED